jgi:hypothetical protein
VSVQAVNLAQFIKQEVGQRVIPPPADNDEDDQLPPTVLMKLDIEGGEFTVLPHLLTQGALCNIVDVAFVEFHGRFLPSDYPKRKIHNMSPTFYSWMVDMTPDCPLTIDFFDDETYLYDAKEAMLPHVTE